MERKLQIEECRYKDIIEFSKKLAFFGVEGSDFYYEDDGFLYMRLQKPYKKSFDGDPEYNFVYVDFYIDQTNRVTDYKVMANFSHEHFSSNQKASELVIGLIRGEVAEVSLNFHDKRASFFIRNSILAEDTIKHIQTNFQDIIALLSQNRCSEGGHLHEKSPISFPYNLLCDYGVQPILDGVTVYIIHTSFSSNPEIRVIQ